MISRYTVRKKSRALLVGVLRLLFLIGLCFIILYPLFKEVTSAFMGLSDVYNSSVKYIPTSLTLTNFYNAWDMLHYPVSLYKTLGTVVLVSLVHMVSSALVAYGFARYDFRMKNLLFALMLFFMVVPPDVLLVPYFLEFRQFQLIDTPWPFVLLGATCMGLKNGIYVFMLRQYFRGIPKELEEAAYVDGAGTMKTLVRVILPGASSMLLTVFLFSFVWQWLDATYTPVFCSNSELVPVLIGTLESPLNHISLSGAGSQLMTASLVRNAGIVLAIFPLVILYAFVQKYFVQSVERSGLVG